jgi:pimeloyl-ACP methyl ester carboxylesterase
MHKIFYRKQHVQGLDIFYRECGPVDGPVLLLLHGYPTSSLMFRNLIPLLAPVSHIIAPDLPGFGFSDKPPVELFHYTFEHLTAIIQAFIDSLELKRFALYIFDYGAPVGLRLALANREKISAIISQNGNAYEEGLSKEWNPIQNYWKEGSHANRDKLREFLTIKGTTYQYRQGASDVSLIAPETYTLDQHFMDQAGNKEIQLDLLLDYQTNVALYPKFQEYFREEKPPLLAVWGNRDPFFLPAGAEAYLRDNPNVRLKFYDTGHFALETHAVEIAADILQFLNQINTEI